MLLSEFFYVLIIRPLFKQPLPCGKHVYRQSVVCGYIFGGICCYYEKITAAGCPGRSEERRVGKECP